MREEPGRQGALTPNGRDAAAGIERFLDAVDLLAPDKETSVFYGQIAAGLARAGTPIPQNDIWIAALARQTGLPVATTDDHFDRVTNLAVLKW